MSKLIHTQDGYTVGEYALAEGRWQIGRRPDNDIRLDDITVSGYHATVEVKPSAYLEGLTDIVLEDRGSTNGTRVNGQAVKQRLLKHGDVVQIGTHELRVVDEANLGFETTVMYLPEDE